MLNQVEKQCEPIPGYRVTEYLGSGGYGEVWKAEAPGGLTKAIKFVFGCHTEQRASAELKALERIREVRHPFLLSVERIEIVQGHLVIVTELADESLRDRFNACRAEGRPGIPRDELMRYLRDAADALDFMGQRHSLQHLDVKPENMLLLSGRIKVADFGLVKNFRHVTASLMGGLTPVYSAPEVFRGAPSHCSDQYSLALLYQEMLTGVLPFAADSPAELTLRHLNDPPNLTSLPESDRPIIARALAKQPLDRFASCADLAEALAQVGKTRVWASGPGPVEPTRIAERLTPAGGDSPWASQERETPPPSSLTMVCAESSAVLGAARGQGTIHLPPLPEPRVTDLPPVRSEPGSWEAVPTLFLGIGGTAGHVLRHLRRRLHERFGGPSETPSFRMLLLDTDVKALSLAMQGDERSALTPDQILEMPLRRPQEYRASSSKLLGWLNRRWLYNIPRSLETEGLRPLGRLAFVDHAQAVFAKVRQAIVDAVNPEAVAATAQHTGLELKSNGIRVYLVASISGGAGSGAVIDLAYAVRAILGRLSVADDGVNGILLHSTGTTARHRDVSILNAFSWLSEYNHYNRPGGAYPGDASCGLPASDPHKQAFSSAYLSHLGDGLAEEDFIEATARVAEYIHLDSVTPARTFFQACRRRRDSATPLIADQAELRTFGVFHATCFLDEMVDATASALCQSVLSDWLGKGDRPAPRDDRQRASQYCAELGLTIEQLRKRTGELVLAQLGGDARQAYERLLVEMSTARSSAGRHPSHVADHVFGAPDQGDAATAGACLLGRPIADLVRRMAESLGGAIRQWALAQIAHREFGVAGVKTAVECVADALRTLEQDAQGLAEQCRQARSQVFAQAGRAGATVPSKREPTGLDPGLKCFLARLDECVAESLAALATRLISEARQTWERLMECERDLRARATTAQRPSNERRYRVVADMTTPELRVAIRAVLSQRHDELVAQLHQSFQSECSDKPAGLHEILVYHSDQRDRMLAAMHRTGRRLVVEAIREADFLAHLLAAGPDAAPGRARLRAYLDQATPELLKHGGARRLLAMLPDAGRSVGGVKQLEEHIGAPLSVVAGPANEFTLCCEAEQLSVMHVAANLIGQRSDYVELARRVHTRCDVQWSSLTELQWTKTIGRPELAACLPAVAGAGCDSGLPRAALPAVGLVPAEV